MIYWASPSGGRRPGLGDVGKGGEIEEKGREKNKRNTWPRVGKEGRTQGRRVRWKKKLKARKRKGRTTRRVKTEERKKGKRRIAEIGRWGKNRELGSRRGGRKKKDVKEGMEGKERRRGCRGENFTFIGGAVGRLRRRRKKRVRKPNEKRSD